MKSIYQIILIILCTGVGAYQATAQNINNVKTTNSAGNIVSEQDLIEIFEKTGMIIKNLWVLNNRDTEEPVYHLYIPKSTLVRAGVKVNTKEESVPVYVETATGSYEPLLTDKAGQFNVPVGGESFGIGSVITGDGFILTTRTIAAPWKMNSVLSSAYESLGMDLPPGITMSSDLKRVIKTDTPSPDFWIPEETASRNGMVGKFNVRVESRSGGYSGKSLRLAVFQIGKPQSYKAQLIRTSSRQDVGIIKMSVPGTLPKSEMFDNYDSLKKGENLFVIITDHTKGLAKSKMIAMPFTVSSISRANEAGNLTEMGDAIRLTDNLDNSTSFSKDQTEKMREFFKILSYSGMPVYNNRGQVIGIYSNYKSDVNGHYIIPIRYGIELIQ